MENKNYKTPAILNDVQLKLDKIIEEAHHVNEENLLYYQAIRKLIDFTLNEKEVKRQFKEFEDVMIAMGRMDFTRRIRVENSKDLFAYLGSCLNMLNEELEENVVPKEFIGMIMEHVMELKPDFAMLTTLEGTIQFVSNNPGSVIYFSKEKLIGQRIQNFISTKIDFTATSMQEQEVNIINSDSKLVPAIISVIELNHPSVALPSYLYMFKEKRD